MKNVSQILGVLTKDSYRDQIASPEWKEFSRSIRQTRGACEVCRQRKDGTQVHHIFYDFSRKLWEYGPDAVIVLCAECHRQMHDNLNTFRRQVFKNLTPQSFRALNLGLAIGFENNEKLEFAYALTELASDPRAVKNFCRAWTERTAKSKTQPVP